MSANDPATLRTRWREARRPAIVIDEVFTADECRRLREGFEAADPQPRWLAHRHRYTAATIPADAIPEQLVARIADVTETEGLTLEAVDARRCGPGDYLLLEDDPPPSRPHLEAVLDVSAASGERGPVAYCVARQPFFVAPQRAGSLTVVARTPEVQRYMPYLAHTDPTPHRIYRLFLRVRAS
jgi:hypothetical protein